MNVCTVRNPAFRLQWIFNKAIYLEISVLKDSKAIKVLIAVMIITFLKYTWKRDLTKKSIWHQGNRDQESQYFCHVESGILDRLVSKIPTTNRILNPLWYRLCRFHDLESAWHCTLNGRDIYKSWKNCSWVIKFSNSWSKIQKVLLYFTASYKIVCRQSP